MFNVGCMYTYISLMLIHINICMLIHIFLIYTFFPYLNCNTQNCQGAACLRPPGTRKAALPSQCSEPGPQLCGSRNSPDGVLKRSVPVNVGESSEADIFPGAIPSCRGAT